MTTSNARYIISAAVRSSSDEDGTTLLHVAENKIYGSVGLGSVIWQKLKHHPNINSACPKAYPVSSSFDFREAKAGSGYASPHNSISRV